MELLVDLKSDLAPGVELAEVRVTLLEDGRELDLVSVDRDATLAEPGIRIARVGGLSPSSARRIEVVAWDVVGEEVTRQTVVVVNRDDAATTVLVTRDCRGVTCEDADTRCLGNRCVDQTCLTGAEESCPEPACTSDTECAGVAECAVPACVDGVCVAVEDASRCGAELYCDAQLGCRGIPSVLDECDMHAYLAPEGCAGDCTVRVRDVSASWLHTCWVDDVGAVWCTGRNEDGQLGSGDRYGRLEPVRVELPPAQRIGTGDGFSCALLEDGSIRCWGRNDDGQLGVGDRVNRPLPATAIAGGPWVDVFIEYDVACALDEAAGLWCWGDDVEGQIGDGGDPEDALVPVALEGTWRTVGQGQGHVCAVRTDGTLWCWGRNTESQLGQPGAREQERAPIQVGTDTDWVTVDGSQSGTCATKTDGTLWCWGEPQDDSLALGDEEIDAPRVRPDGMDWVEADVSIFHGCGLRGDVGWCWGRGFEGQTGVVQTEPVPPRIVEGGPWVDVEVGRFTSFFVRDDGALFGSGNDCGRLGMGVIDGSDGFVEVER